MATEMDAKTMAQESAGSKIVDGEFYCAMAHLA
jgi:hypothetical protein